MNLHCTGVLILQYIVLVPVPVTCDPYDVISSGGVLYSEICTVPGTGYSTCPSSTKLSYYYKIETEVRLTDRRRPHGRTNFTLRTERRRRPLEDSGLGSLLRFTAFTLFASDFCHV